MKVTLLGTGYVGLVAGACLAEMGDDMACVDIDAAKVDQLKRGELAVVEAVNHDRKPRLFELTWHHPGGDLERRTVAPREPAIFDGRNHAPSAPEACGLAYCSIRRGRSLRAASVVA